MPPGKVMRRWACGLHAAMASRSQYARLLTSTRCADLEEGAAHLPHRPHAIPPFPPRRTPTTRPARRVSARAARRAALEETLRSTFLAVDAEFIQQAVAGQWHDGSCALCLMVRLPRRSFRCSFRRNSAAKPPDGVSDAVSDAARSPMHFPVRFGSPVRAARRSLAARRNPAARAAPARGLLVTVRALRAAQAPGIAS